MYLKFGRGGFLPPGQQQRQSMQRRYASHTTVTINGHQAKGGDLHGSTTIRQGDVQHLNSLEMDTITVCLSNGADWFACEWRNRYSRKKTHIFILMKTNVGNNNIYLSLRAIPNFLGIEVL